MGKWANAAFPRFQLAWLPLLKKQDGSCLLYSQPSLGALSAQLPAQLSIASGVVSAHSKWGQCHSKGTGKINNSRVLPCQVCNSRVALLKLCMQELKENWSESDCNGFAGRTGVLTWCASWMLGGQECWWVRGHSMLKALFGLRHFVLYPVERN